MIETVFRSDLLPPAERLAGWNEVASAGTPTKLRTDRPENFDATARMLTLGPVRLAVLTCPTLCSDRTPRLIRRSDPELYHLVLAPRGTVGLEQSGRQLQLERGQVGLATTSRPYRARLLADGGGRGRVTLVQVLVPRALVPFPQDEVDRLLALPFPGAGGPGELFTRFVATMISDRTRYGPAESAQLGSVALGLASTLLAHHLGAPPGPLPAADPAHAALALRVRDHIRRHLADPELRPETIAAAHHISLRSLHRLFQSQDTTPAAYIRHQRLECARRDLADPALADRPVRAVAARWGFPRPSDFTRAFRAAYGLPPRDYRSLALGPVLAPYAKQLAPIAHDTPGGRG